MSKSKSFNDFLSDLNKVTVAVRVKVPRLICAQLFFFLQTVQAVVVHLCQTLPDLLTAFPYPMTLQILIQNKSIPCLHITKASVC